MNTDWRTIQVVPAPKHGNVEVFERTGEMPGEYTSTSLLRLFGVLLQQHAKTGETRIVLAAADDHGRITELIPGVSTRRFVGVMWDGGTMDPDSLLARSLDAWAEWGIVPDDPPTGRG